MTDKEIVERLNAYSAQYQNHGGITAEAADRIEQLRAELTNEKIDNTNLIGELATVTAERDRYKAERDAAVRDMKQNTKCYICKNFPKDNNISHCKHFYNCGLAYINWEWRGLEGNT